MSENDRLLIKRSELPKYLKQTLGIDVSNACIERWLRQGVRGHILPCQFVGGCRYVSETDLNEFLEHKNRPTYQTAPLGGMVQDFRAKEQQEKITKKQRQEGVEQAAASLERRGIDTNQETV